MTVSIRFVREQDLDELIELCKLHAEFEQVSYTYTGQKERLKHDFFNQPKLYGLVAEGDEGLLGYATYMIQYSTWSAESYAYMDCLFVREEARGRRLGEQLVARVLVEAENQNCTQVQWQTPSFNKRAMKFYKRLGAVSKTKERFFLLLR